MDERLQELERAARANPGDAEALEAAYQAFRRADVNLPRDLLLETPGWRELCALVEHWFSGGGYTSSRVEDEIAKAEERLGITLPPLLREWYALVGERSGISSFPTSGAWIPKPEGLELDKGGLILMPARVGPRIGIALEDLGRVDPPVSQWTQEGERSPHTECLSKALANLVRTRLVSGGCLPGQRTAVERTRVDYNARQLGLPYLGEAWRAGYKVHGSEDILVLLGERGPRGETNYVATRTLAVAYGIPWWPRPRPSTPKDSGPIDHHRRFIKRQGGPKSAEDYDD